MPRSRPPYHPNLLLVKVGGSPRGWEGMSTFRTLTATGNPGLIALDRLERAGLVKRVTPVAETPSADAGLPLFHHFRASVLDAPPSPVRGVNLVELTDEADLDATRMALAADPAIELVERVPFRYLVTGDRGGSEVATAVAPPLGTLWNLKKIRWYEARSHAGFDPGEDICVAVLDTGVDPDHPALRDAIDQYTWSYAGVPGASDRDVVGHGTHVSGTVAARRLPGHDEGVDGITRARLRAWKIFSDEPTLFEDRYGYVVDPVMYLRALDGCARDVDVVNLSIGGPGHSAQEAELFRRLTASGVAVVAAMGNDREWGSPVSYPAAYPGVVAVGATKQNDRVASFSSSGRHIAVCAPGESIWSTLPTYEGNSGYRVASGPGGRPVPGAPIHRDMDFDAWDGTSMATPHVSGALALLKAGNPGLTVGDMRQRLADTVEHVGEMGAKPWTPDHGAGRLDVYQLLWK